MENLDEALAQLINTALAGIDTSTEFLQAQLPEVIVQLMAWYAIKSAFGFIIVAVLLATIVKQGIKWVPRAFNHDDIGGAFLGAFFSFMGLLLLGLLFDSLAWLQIWIAPKVWLLEYAANLVK